MTEFADPQAQAAYDAEMSRLSGEAAPSVAAVDEKAAAVEDTKAEIAAEQSPDRLAELEAKLERQEKALKDTQRAMHAKSQELAALKREREIERNEAQRPDLLKNVPELEGAIRFVTGAPENLTEDQRNAMWLEAVSGAVPDVEELLKDKDFEAAALARRDEIGASEWQNPLAAIRELTTLRESFRTRKAVEAAVEKAKADYAKQQAELNAMRVPGGNGKTAAADRQAAKDAEQVWSMPQADFERERQKVLGGYSR